MENIFDSSEVKTEPVRKTEEWQYFCVVHICMYINLNDPFCLKNGTAKGKKGRIGRIEEHLSWTYLCINLNDPFCFR